MAKKGKRLSIPCLFPQPLFYSMEPAKTCMRYFFSMEREKRIEDIKPLLKVIIPLAFPIAGFIVSALMTSRTSERDPSISPSREERETDSHLYVSQHEFDDESSSHCIDEPFGNGEAEDKELETANSLRRSPTARQVTVMERYENPDEISIEQEEEGLNLNEEIASLKSTITVLEERVREFENRFHDYYYMKEEESTFQKLQIMCLGLKQELFESRNQRLEGTVAGLDAIRADYAMLQQKFKRLSKINTRNSRIIRQEASNLNARGIELSKEKAELELAMREIKDLGNQFQEERKAMQENLKTAELMNKCTSKDKEEVEVPIEECNIRQLLSGKEETLDQLGQIRERRAGDMEEMIYVGWIAACLRRELTMNQQEEITRVGKEEALALPREKGDLLTAYTLAATAEVQSCCVDFDQEHRSSGKRRLLRKLKGWAKLKGKSKSKGSRFRDDKSYQKMYDSS